MPGVFKTDERELDRQYQAFVKQIVASGAGDAIWAGENPIEFAARKAAASAAQGAAATFLLLIFWKHFNAYVGAGVIAFTECHLCPFWAVFTRLQ